MPEQLKRTTLKDVAALAGVDASLVSRVVSRDRGITIPESTRQRILDAVAATNYRPSATARGLRMQKLSTFGLIIPDIANPVYAPIVRGAQARSFDAGYALLLASDTEVLGRRAAKHLIRMLAEDRVDGLLVASGTKNSELLQTLSDIAKPVVLVNRAIGDTASHIVDDEAGARMATDHLLSMGHTRIAHLGGPLDVDTTVRRTFGYTDALTRRNAPIGVTVNAAGWGAGDGYQAGLHLLKQIPDATAVFAANVTLAVGLYRAAHELDLQIPTDLSVVALHDYDLAAMLVPSLTTVKMPLEELGSAAVQQLLEIVEGGPPSTRIVASPPELMERGSVARR